jgi:hypothetical protein
VPSTAARLGQLGCLLETNSVQSFVGASVARGGAKPRSVAEHRQACSMGWRYDPEYGLEDRLRRRLQVPIVVVGGDGDCPRAGFPCGWYSRTLDGNGCCR